MFPPLNLWYAVDQICPVFEIVPVHWPPHIAYRWSVGLSAAFSFKQSLYSPSTDMNTFKEFLTSFRSGLLNSGELRCSKGKTRQYSQHLFLLPNLLIVQPRATSHTQRKGSTCNDNLICVTAIYIFNERIFRLKS